MATNRTADDRPDRLNPYIRRRAFAYLILNSLAWAAVLSGFYAISRPHSAPRIALAVGLFAGGAVAAVLATVWRDEFRIWMWWPGPGERGQSTTGGDRSR